MSLGFSSTREAPDKIYSDCLKRLNVGCEVYLTETDVIGFLGDVLISVGEVTILVSLGDRPVIATGSVKFLIMDVESPFNMILGRPSLNMFQVVVSTYHAKIKFPVNELVGEVRGDIPGKSGMLQFRPHINQIDLRKPVSDEKAKYDVIGRGDGVWFFKGKILLSMLFTSSNSDGTSLNSYYGPLWVLQNSCSNKVVFFMAEYAEIHEGICEELRYMPAV